MYKIKIKKGEICPYCYNKPELVDSSEVYGRSYGLIYLCRDCDAYVGVHVNSKKNIPLGRLANKELREAKKKAHKYFDPLWEAKMSTGIPKKKARFLAYKWLSSCMGLRMKDTHIGMFDIEQCNQVIYFCKNYNKDLNTLNTC